MSDEKTDRGSLVALRDDGVLALFDPESIYEPRIVLYQDEVKALRAFFQEERDTELNRWRDPENPDMVCYPINNRTLNNRTIADVRVLDERTGELFFYSRDSVLDQKFCPSFETATRYYASNPIVRPWEDAKEGEYWLVTWTHIHTPDPCVVVSVDNDLYFQGRRQARDTSSEYIRHAQKLVVEED